MERLTIIGSGTMGHSIALNAAWAGVDVKMYGLTEKDILAGMLEIDKKLAILAMHKVINWSEAGDILKRITPVSTLDSAVNEATFIIECIPEDIVLKSSLFKQLDAICKPEVVLASNTSGLRLSDLAHGANYPERILITHFWNPAHLVPLVEVLRALETSEDAFSRALILLHVMRKKPIEVKKEVPGLVGNRLQFALFREAQYLLDQGIATKEDIDAAVTFGIGRRLSVTGPLMSADMGGLDVFSSVSDNLFNDLSKADESYPALRELVDAGKYGVKSGEGYYEWSEQFSCKMRQLRETELIRLLKTEV